MKPRVPLRSRPQRPCLQSQPPGASAPLKQPPYGTLSRCLRDPGCNQFASTISFLSCFRSQSGPWLRHTNNHGAFRARLGEYTSEIAHRTLNNSGPSRPDEYARRSTGIDGSRHEQPSGKPHLGRSCVTSQSPGVTPTTRTLAVKAGCASDREPIAARKAQPGQRWAPISRSDNQPIHRGSR